MRLRLLALIAAVVQWTSLASVARAQDDPNTSSGVAAMAPCQLPGLSRPVRCGVFELPENPDRPTARRLKIAAAVVPAASGKALADPIVMFMGGPGEDAISGASYFAAQFEGLLHERDLVLVDQRGTGRSSALRCDLYSPDEAAASLQDFFPVAAVKRCAQASSARADLSQYTYAHLARDIEHIRRALGYGKLNLYAGSYGTRGAQAYLRAYPQNVRTVYFGSVVPTDVTIPVPIAKAAQAALDRTFAACADDAACHAAFPDFPREFREILSRLDAGVRVAVPGSPAPAPLTRGRVAEFLRSKLYRAEGAAQVPWLIHQAHAGNWSPIVEGILSYARQRDSESSAGLFFSIACNEDVAFIREDEVAAQTSGSFGGDYRVRQQQRACSEWPRSPVPPGYREPVRSSVPALFSSGDVDPASPLWFTERVAPNFPNRIEVVMRNQGHTEWNACLGRLYERFVSSGSVRGLDPACEAVPRPAFKTTS